MKNDKVIKATKVFGIKIRIERVKLGISQEKLAEMADISRPTIGAIERGENNPSLDTIFALSQALNVPLKELMDLEI